MEYIVDGLSIGHYFVRTSGFLLVKSCLYRVLTYVLLYYEAKGADDVERVVLHLHYRLHGLSSAFEGHVHEKGGEDVVHVMT